MVTNRLCVAALLVLATSCATSSASSDPGAPSSPGTTSRAARNPNVIGAEELHDPTMLGLDALRAIRYLRPMFFRATGPQSLTNMTAGLIQISWDYGPLQPLGLLTSFSTLSVIEVRYLDANEAHGRFGLSANGGPVIVMVSSKQ